MRHGTCAVACLTVALVACGRAPGSGVTVADSAGVRITLTRDADRTFASVDSQPVLSLGGPEATGPTQFSRIAGVYVDPHDNIWVADGASAELRLFRPDGTHWKTRGGQGEGPGEFRRLQLLGAFRGDSVACWDARLARLTVFDADGEVARMTGMPPGEEAAPRGYDVFADGTLVAQFPRMLAGGSLEPGQLLADTEHIERLELADLRREPLATAPGPTWLWTGHSQIPIPFTINPGFDLDGSALHLVAGPQFRVRVFEGGRITEIYGVDRHPRPVTPKDIAAYTKVMEERLQEPQRREYLSVVDNAARPRTLPAYSRVVVADDRNVWAQLYSSDVLGAASWDVFDDERHWLGQVETPAGFMLHQVRGENLVGVWRDRLGVEHVRIYRMRHT